MTLKTAIRNSVLVAVFVFTMVGFFQNCTQAVTNGGSNTQYSGNGEGYGGKARFENPVGNCAGGVTNPPGGVNAIERNGRQFNLVRKDCVDITPQPVITPQVEYLPHNQNTAVYEGHIYQVPDSIPPANNLPRNVHRFCRANHLDGQGTGEVVDAYILRASDGTFSARANVVPYSGSFINRPLLDLTFAATNPGAESYSGSGLPTGEFFQLDITLPGVTPLNLNLTNPGAAAPVYRSELVTCYSY